MISYAIGGFEFKGWEMYVFPLACAALAIFLIVVGIKLILQKEASHKDEGL